jgi:glycosyltransferase involved in cell wall biosynthesis
MMEEAAMFPACPRVSVVMSTFNRAELLPKALNSILALEPPPWEVIVIDDGSSDHTAEVLAEFASRVRFECRANGGKSSAINRGVAIATGDWIWICDDDDEVVPNAISVFAKGLEGPEDVDFVYTGLGHLIGDVGGGYRQMLPDKVRLPSSADLEVSLFSGRWIPYLQPVLIRRQIFSAVGGLREDLRRVEDEDFALRLTHGGRGRPVEEVTYLLRVHDGDRGAEGARFSNSMREDVDITFLRAIYENIYRSYPLAAFRLPAGGVGFLPDDPALFRLMIMFRVCSWDIVRDEYCSLRGKTENSRCLVVFQDGITALIDGFSPKKIHDLFASTFFSDLAVDRGTPLRAAILRGMARGLYWSLRRDFGQRKLSGLAGKAWWILRCSMAYKRRSAAAAG